MLATALLLLQAVLVTVPAGGAGDPLPEALAPASPAPAKWTYMVYMSGDNNLEDDMILNINQMEAVGSGGGLDVVIQFDRSPEYDTSNGDWTGTRRYLITNDSDPKVINSTLLQDLGEVDMGQKESLRDFIVWAIVNYPAERYMLDVAGHGGGWRDGTCNDFTSSSYLDMGELKAAVLEARSTTGVTLDGMVFDQCLMAQLEVYYEVKAAADVLVGAEDLIPSEGLNYTRVLEALMADLDMDGRDLGAAIVQAFFDEYGHDNERAFSALDSEALDADLAPAVTQLAQSLSGVASTLHMQIKLARDYARTYYYIDYIDLGNFTEHLLRYLPANETALRAAASRVRDALNGTVVANDHGTGREGSEGATIYFPQWAPPWSYGRISMSGEQYWRAFLDAYFADEDRPVVAPTVEVDEPYDGSVVGRFVTVNGTATDAGPGTVEHIQWKLDRGNWTSVEPEGTAWSVEVSTVGLTPGPHRLSVRAVDDDGAYSEEVHLTVNVEDRWLTARVTPAAVRTFAGGPMATTLNVSSFGASGGLVRLSVADAPPGWSVSLPFQQRTLAPGEWALGTISVTPSASASKDAYKVVVRASMEDAPLIQAFARLTVEVTDRWPDLVVGQIVLDPAEPQDGELVNVSARVRNTGLDATAAFDLNLTYTSLDGSGTNATLTSLRVPSLAIGGEVTVSGQWLAALGLHGFTAEADVGHENPDLFPTDNLVYRELMLAGYLVGLETLVSMKEALAGERVDFTVTLRNDGSLADLISLSVEGPTGWSVGLEGSSFFVGPKATEVTMLYIDVPEDANGGTIVTVRVLAQSSGDPERTAEASVWVLVTETFLLAVDIDTREGVVAPNETVSFNVTIHNGGNGYENYTLEYTRQTLDLLVSAVNDTVEVAPGCSTVVEVFVSSLGSPSGGFDLQVKVTVRSIDQWDVYDAVVYKVSIARQFRARARADALPPPLVPGGMVKMNVSVIYEGNYCTTLVLELLGPVELFGDGPPTGILSVDDAAPGSVTSHSLVLPILGNVPASAYGILLNVYEDGSPANRTRLEVAVTVAAVHKVTVRVATTDDPPLRPGRTWRANLSVANMGNVAENLVLLANGSTGLLFDFPDGEVMSLPPGARIVRLVVRLDANATGVKDGTLTATVHALAAGNHTELDAVTFDLAVDVDEPGDGGDGLATPVVVGLVLVMLALAAAMVVYRHRRQ